MAHEWNKQDSKRRGFLFGRNISNSLSPLLHDTVFGELELDWTYERVDTDDVDLLIKCLQDDILYGMFDTSSQLKKYMVINTIIRCGSDDAT
jgi:shikimate 5-dehydrogenase